MKEQYITITGIKHYYGIIPFEIGRKITCVKEPDNYYDQEAIRCQVKHIRVLVFVNLRSYLTDEQIQELMEEALRQQIYVVLVENSQKNCIEGGKRYIIDKDMCEIL